MIRLPIIGRSKSVYISSNKGKKYKGKHRATPVLGTRYVGRHRKSPSVRKPFGDIVPRKWF